MGKQWSLPAVVLVIGAGPAGIFAAQELVKQGIEVILLNRDIRPGGLAEYGIYYNKHNIKSALRAQFHKILQQPGITYYGNVSVGEDGDLTLSRLGEMGFGAIIVAVGAQGTKWLGLPGEQLQGVYQAKDIIYHYNGLPPFSQREYAIGKRVALIGVGNVMADVAHWLVRDLEVEEVIAVARRGPAEVKFTPLEFAYVAANLDVPALKAEAERIRERMEAVGQDPEAATAPILAAVSRAVEATSDTRLRFRFLASPCRIRGDPPGRVAGLEIEDTALGLTETGGTRATRLGTTEILDVDTVIYCIGDRVSEGFGLPVARFSFAKWSEPRYPVDGISFEAYDPEADVPIKGVFIVGWARAASRGQVGLARKDARNCVKAVMAYLSDAGDPASPDAVRQALQAALHLLKKPVVTKALALRLSEIEAAEAARRGEPGFRFSTNADMLAALGL